MTCDVNAFFGLETNFFSLFFLAAINLISTKVTPSPGKDHMPVARLTLSCIVIYTTTIYPKMHCHFFASLCVFHVEVHLSDMILLLSKNVSEKSDWFASFNCLDQLFYSLEFLNTFILPDSHRPLQ